MKLDFLYEHFSNYEIKTCNEFEVECFKICDPDFEEPIKVYCEFGEVNIYTVCFATQHMHITDKNVLIETITNYANGTIAAIEFYKDGKNCFGGQIEVKYLADITYNSLCGYFGYENLDMTHLTFKVYAWDKEYCFEGFFEKTFFDTVQIIKKY